MVDEIGVDQAYLRGSTLYRDFQLQRKIAKRKKSINLYNCRILRSRKDLRTDQLQECLNEPRNRALSHLSRVYRRLLEYVRKQQYWEVSFMDTDIFFEAIRTVVQSWLNQCKEQYIKYVVHDYSYVLFPSNQVFWTWLLYLLVLREIYYVVFRIVIFHLYRPNVSLKHTYLVPSRFHPTNDYWCEIFSKIGNISWYGLQTKMTLWHEKENGNEVNNEEKRLHVFASFP